MLFNSFEFIVFISLFFLSYWFIFQRSLRLQNFLILVGSYLFYGWWDWRFLSLIFLSSLIDFFIGKAIFESSQPKRKKGLLFMSLTTNLGLLGFFKYYNFFMDSLKDSFLLLGYELHPFTLNVVLPVGISFYTCPDPGVTQLTSIKGS